MRFRNVLFTWNNTPLTKALLLENLRKCKPSSDKGGSGTPHFQGYLTNDSDHPHNKYLDRVDSGPSMWRNASKILSPTVGCFLIMERLSAPTGPVRCLSSPGRTSQIKASEGKRDTGNFTGSLGSKEPAETHPWSFIAPFREPSGQVCH